MNDPQSLRMLLSHNFDLNDGHTPALSREAFTQVFIDGFASDPEVKCRQVDNPHWIVEIVCVAGFLTPQQVGEKCAQILSNSRKQSLNSLTEPLPWRINFDTLVLGGIKTTPATSNSPDALQSNQWGVDVVETKSGEQFLRSISWDTTIAGKPVDTIFKAEIISSS
ncbi:MAG: DUF2656 domain-containing protein [Chamaesiphon sp.]|nr:DUF2656 domain-containing protein [Chamaesiphon sp.]